MAKKIITIIKENLISIILIGVLAIAGTATFGQITNANNLSIKNETRIIVLESNELLKDKSLVQQLEGIVRDLESIDLTTRNHERAIIKLETLISVMRGNLQDIN